MEYNKVCNSVAMDIKKIDLQTEIQQLIKDFKSLNLIKRKRL